MLNHDSATANVRAEVYNSSGQRVETLIFTIPPKGWAQQAVTVNITDGPVEWQTDNLIYAWSGSVDKRSNDGSLNYPTYSVLVARRGLIDKSSVARLPAERTKAGKTSQDLIESGRRREVATAAKLRVWNAQPSLRV